MVRQKNGELLGLITLTGFDFFITLDKNLRHQQNLEKFDKTIILLYPANNKHQILQPFIEEVKLLLNDRQYKKFNEIKI